MAPTETVKVKKSVAEMVRWMNTEGGLVAELRLAAIAKPLAALDESTALEVLNAVLEQEEPVDDPTVWVCEAAKALAAEEAGDGFYDEPAPAPKPASGVTVKLPASTVERVKALNAEGTLQAPLLLGDIAEPLSLISKEAQEQILTALEERATSIVSPVNWVINGCYKKAGKGKSKGKGQNMAKGKSKGDSAVPSKGKGKGKTKALTASEQKILRTLNFITHSFHLERPLKFPELKESLDLVDEKTQLRILQRLKDKLSEGEEVANPSTYIKRACERAYQRYEEMVQEKKKRKAAEASGETAPARKKQAKAATEAAAGQEEWDEEAWDEAWEEE